MSLGWLNLQEYLGANQGSADEMAQRLDAQQADVDAQASQAAASGNSMSYGQFLQKRRQMASQRADESGRAAMLGGNVTDAFLAAKGRSTYSAPTGLPSVNDVQRRADASRQQEADYWARQAERNKGLAAERDAARKKQDDSVTAAKKAMEERAGGPGYRAYSDSVARSFDKSRGRQVRVVDSEEADRWTR